jgi:PAS domain S-box-containing protein
MNQQKSVPGFLSILLRKNHIPYRSEKMDQIQSNICDGVLISIATLSIPAVITSVSRAFEIGIKPVMFVHVFFAIILWASYLTRKHLPYSFRAIIIILIFYIVAVTGVLQFGLLAPASAWFIIIPVLSAILFNIRVGLGLALFTFFSFILIATLDVKGFLTFDLNAVEYSNSILVWLNYSMTYLIAGGVLFVAVSISVNNLMDALGTTDSIAKELNHLIDAANVPIFYVNNNGLINDWNKASEKITGFAKEEVLGKNLIENYITEDYRELVKQVLDDALEGKETANFEFPLFTKTGDRIMILLNSSTRRDASGKIFGMLGVGQEITKLVNYRNELELKVSERTLKINDALKKEKELNELKTKFISTSSHEFRTPLSAINFAAGSIKKYWTKMEPIIIAEKLTKIEDQVLHLTRLLDDILIVGQADAGKFKNTPLPINMGVFINDIIEEVSHSSKKSHEILLIDPEELKSTTLFIDEKLGRNIFINLLSNAVKFSPDAKKVTIELSSEIDYIVFSITDFGIGIPRSELKDIFTPFSRGKNVDLIQGTGLGLTIAKEAIDIIGGEIIINSTTRSGTTIIVKIPKIQIKEHV